MVKTADGELMTVPPWPRLLVVTMTGVGKCLQGAMLLSREDHLSVVSWRVWLANGI
jgi:hypothetical protein